MAKGKSLESLYITLGLDVSQLTSDFIAADKTVAENMAKINRESNLLKLRMQVDTGNLDPVKDAAQILAIKTQILNEQLAMQKDRVKMASAAWLDKVHCNSFYKIYTKFIQNFFFAGKTIIL